MENTDNTQFDEELVKQTYPKLYAALIGPKEPLQEQLVLASLFVMSFECLKDYVEENFQTFFSNGFETTENGQTELIFPKDFRERKLKYQNLYKDLSFRLLNKEVKGANLFQIAIAWLYQLEALSDEDFILIFSSNQIRNNLAHELYRWLLDDESPTLNKDLVYAPLNLYFKISNWWVINFESAVDPEAYQHYSESDMKSAMSFNVQILLQLLHRFYPENSN